MLRQLYHWSDERGAAAVEFAFISLLIIMVVFGAVEVGRVFYTYSTLITALGPTTRLVEQEAPASVIEDKIRSHFSSSEQGALTIQIQPGFSIDGAVYTRIDAQYALPLLVPAYKFFPGNIYTLKSIHLIPTS